MSKIIDPWLIKDLQITKSVFNHNLQACKSPQVIGRKINNACQTLKSPKHCKNKPNIVLLPVSTVRIAETSRPKTTKRSPCRSLSLHKIVTEKDSKLDIRHFVSPIYNRRIKRKQIKQQSETFELDKKVEKTKPFLIKNILTQSLSKLQHEKQENLKKELEEKNIQCIKKEKLKNTNERIRKENLKTIKSSDLKHPKP